MGQPEDGGLYFPSELPRGNVRSSRDIAELSNAEIAHSVMRPFVDGDIADDELYSICQETVEIPFPIVKLNDNISVLELFHGPTLAFKDVGARFMSRCLGHFSTNEHRKTLVVVATSGDTGGAVANGFHGVEGVEVVIIYPKGRVSHVQELQLTTLGGNVSTLELLGSFDDCQKLAKQALSDRDLRRKTRVTSANSINIARWLPQQFYYYFAVKQWQGDPPVMSLPSGNFGNLAAGMLAERCGLELDGFIAACNANDVVPRFLATGDYETRDAVTTLSNAMDVGAPSNFVRIMEMYGGNVDELLKKVSAVSISDEETAAVMRQVHEQCNYIMDPHTAVATKALQDRVEREPDVHGIVVATAHPVKFDSVLSILGVQAAVPPAVKDLMTRAKASIEVENDYDAVKEILLSRI